MNGYFKPWRRKIGVVTLVLACVFAAGWVRSRAKFDFVNIVYGSSCCRIASCFGLISIKRETPFDGRSGWTSGDLSTVTSWLDQNGKLTTLNSVHVEWRLHLGDIDIGAGTSKRATQERITVCTLPYWYFVASLTLLSAYLLLSKPRSAAKSPSTNAGTERV